jgi:hypothetical protein
MAEPRSAHPMNSRAVAGTEPALLEFLKATVNSFIKWDLAHFFHTNPHTADTADNLAHYIGRDPGEVAAQLDELVASGLVERQTVGSLPTYALTGEPMVRGLLARFVAACQDQQFRTQAIYHLVRAAKD